MTSQDNMKSKRCLGLTRFGKQCGKPPGVGDMYCHIHSRIEASKSLELQSRKTGELYGTISILNNENERLQATVDLLEDENKTLRSKLKAQSRPEQKSKYIPPKELDPKDPRAKKLLSNKQAEINLLTKRLAEANAMIDKLQPDYDRYQIIKSFESLHRQLEQEKIRFNHRGELYHDLRMTRNRVAHPSA